MTPPSPRPLRAGRAPHRTAGHRAQLVLVEGPKRPDVVRCSPSGTAWDSHLGRRAVSVMSPPRASGVRGGELGGRGGDANEAHVRTTPPPRALAAHSGAPAGPAGGRGAGAPGPPRARAKPRSKPSVSGSAGTPSPDRKLPQTHAGRRVTRSLVTSISRLGPRAFVGRGVCVPSVWKGLCAGTRGAMHVHAAGLSPGPGRQSPKPAFLSRPQGVGPGWGGVCARARGVCARRGVCAGGCAGGAGGFTAGGPRTASPLRRWVGLAFSSSSPIVARDKGVIR